MDNEKILKDFAKHLRELRLEKGFSQEDFALATGLSRTHIARLESGKHNPTLLTLVTIANALQISFISLLSFMPEN